jgi:hypothetical protein
MDVKGHEHVLELVKELGPLMGEMPSDWFTNTATRQAKWASLSPAQQHLVGLVGMSAIYGAMDALSPPATPTTPARTKFTPVK